MSRGTWGVCPVIQVRLRLSLYQLGCFGLWLKESHTKRGSNVRKKLCCIMRTLEGGNSRMANSAARKKVSFSSHCLSSEWICGCVFFFFFFNLIFFFFWLHYVACRLLVPWLGVEPVHPELEAWSLNHWTASEVSFFHWFIFCNQ